MAVSSLDIVVGTTWKNDVRCLSRLSAYRRSGDAFDFSVVHDIIDIVVDGANITSRLPEDSIFHLISELVHGLLLLCEGRVDKHIIGFQETSWEMAIQPSQAYFELSLYGVGTTREVAAHNLKVRRRSMIEAVCDSAEQLVRDLFELNPAFTNDETIGTLIQSVERLRGLDEPDSKRDTPYVTPANVGPVRKSFGDRPLRLEIEFDGSHQDLWRYEGAQSVDLHSLLFKGSLTLSYWGRKRRLAESTYLFPLLGGLVLGAERLLRTLEVRAGGAVLLELSDGASCLLTAEVEDAEHLLLRVSESARPPGQTATTADRVFEVFLGLVESVLDEIVSLNPRQNLNGCICEVRAKLVRLRARFLDLRNGDVLFEQVEGYLRRAPDVAACESRFMERGDLPVSIEEARHLFLSSTWLLVRNQIDYRHITGLADSLLVPSRSRVEAIDSQTGKPLWARPRTTLLGAGEASLLLAEGTRLSCQDALDGSTRWELELPQEPTDACLFMGGSEPYAVVSIIDAELAAFDLRSGEQTWTYGLEHGELAALVLAGPVLVVVTSDGFTHGVGATEGRLLWRIRTSGSCAMSPQVHDGRLYMGVDSEPGYESVLLIIDPLSGNKLHEIRVPASFATRPLLAGSTGFFPLEFPGGATVLAMDLKTGEERWSRQIESAHVAAPAMVWPRSHPTNPLVVKTDTGTCFGFDPKDGETLWSIDLLEPGDVLLANLEPTVLDGCLVVPERFISIINPANGRRLHRLDQLPEHPTFLHVDSDLRLLVGEGEGHLECFDLKGFLALV